MQTLIPLIVPAKTSAQALQIAREEIDGFQVNEQYGAQKLTPETTELGFFLVYGQQTSLPGGGQTWCTDPNDPNCLPGGA